MKRKYFLFILQFLTSMCIVSVGFASWTIVSGTSIEEEGSIQAEDITNSTEYVDITEISPLKYYQTGFVTGNEGSYVVSNQGTSSFNCLINIDNCKRLYTTANNLKVTIYLNTNVIKNGNTDTSLFNDVTITHSLSNIDNSTGDIIPNDNTNTPATVYYVSFVIEDVQNMSGSIESTLNFNFTISDISNFASIYSYLEKVEFETSAIVEEVE